MRRTHLATYATSVGVWGPVSVAVMGAGNGGCAVAGELSLSGHDVRLFNRTAARIERLVAQDGINVARPGGTEFAKPSTITTDLEVAVRGTSVLVICAPTPALAAYVPLLKPLVRPDQLLLINPGHTGGALYAYAALRGVAKECALLVCETATLTHTCRMRDPGTVWIPHRVEKVSFAAMPASDTPRAWERLQGLFPELAPVTSVLETSLENLNAVEHPAQMIANAARIEDTGGEFKFYYEGTTPAVGRLIEAVDRERLALAASFSLELPTFVEAFYKYGYTDRDGLASGTVYGAMQRSEPNRYIKAPSTLDHRYIYEDVGWGLVPWVHLATRMGVDVPAMRALTTVASILHGVDYLSTGLNLEMLGLDRFEPQEIRRYVADGTVS